MHRRRFLKEPQTAVALDPLRGLQLMSRNRASQVHAAADRVLAHGRRILCRTGLNGASKWHIPDTQQMSLSHPSSTDNRVVARTPPISLTPGHFLRMMFVALPSGMTTQPDGLGSYEEGGASGSVKIEVLFDNGTDTETITKEIAVEGSKLANGAQPSAEGSSWAALSRHRTQPIYPADFKNVQNLAAWCDGVTVTITVSYIGSPRVVSLVVHEEPFGFAYDANTDNWIAPMHSNDGGGSLGDLQGPFPFTKFGASDNAGGVLAITQAAKRLCQEIGPVVWYWSSWQEGNQNVTDTEAAPRATSTVGPEARSQLTENSTNFAYATARPLSSTAACVNATRVQDSEAQVVMRGKENVIPVRFWAYAAMSTAVGSPTATIRFACASNNSQSHLTIAAGTSYAWHSVIGYIRVGVGPENLTGIFASIAVSATSTVNIRYVMITYENH